MQEIQIREDHEEIAQLLALEAAAESPDNSGASTSGSGEKSNAQILKEQVSFSKLLLHHGHDVIPGGNFMKCICPFHKDLTETFYIWGKDDGGRCYSCDWRGDIYDYLMKRGKLGFREALEKLEKLAPKILRDGKEAGRGDH